MSTARRTNKRTPTPATVADTTTEVSTVTSPFTVTAESTMRGVLSACTQITEARFRVAAVITKAQANGITLESLVEHFASLPEATRQSVEDAIGQFNVSNLSELQTIYTGIGADSRLMAGVKRLKVSKHDQASLSRLLDGGKIRYGTLVRILETGTKAELKAAIGSNAKPAKTGRGSIRKIKVSAKLYAHLVAKSDGNIETWLTKVSGFKG